MDSEQEARERERELYLCAVVGNEAPLRELLQAGVSFQARFISGRQALHEAAQRCFAGCVQALLEFGANPNSLAHGGASPLCLSMKPGSANGFSVALMLLNAGADVNGRDADGVGALWWAASRGSTELLRELLNRGADPNDRPILAGQNGSRLGPPLSALQREHWGEAPMIERLEMLLGAGANPLGLEGEREFSAQASKAGAAPAFVERLRQAETAARVERERAVLDQVALPGAPQKRAGL